MLNQTRNVARKFGAKVAAASALVLVASAAHATSPIDDLFAAVDISGIATKVTALAIVIVGIALVMKGPSIVKRIIAKI